MNTEESQLPYLQLLAKLYPSIRAASTAIVDLTAQLNLPKGTEHFVSDVHGEYEAFRHVLKNGSGSIKRSIEETFGDSLSEDEKRTLATLIYYPEAKLPLILKSISDEAEWYRTTLVRLIKLCRDISSKYPRARVRSFMPDDLAGIIEELLHEQEHIEDKAEYYQSIIETIISTDSARTVIVALVELIQRLAIARLHILGDVYDRGPAAELIMDTLINYHSVDLLWGNHDMLWMGAAAGSEACIANVIRIALRYGNVTTLEHGYGISLLPLASFTVDTYGDDPCQQFLQTPADEDDSGGDERRLVGQMHKAITILQLKLEAQIILRQPQFQMEDRLLLDKIDHQSGTIRINGTVYPLLDNHFPTIDPRQPFELTAREKVLIERLRLSFTSSTRLQQHTRFLFSKGGMYLVYNGNLLYHGCIPMNDDGSFRSVHLGGQVVAGKSLMDRLDRLARQGYFATDKPAYKQEGMDIMWYLWSGAQSPLFGTEKMATFERYFIADKTTHEEKRNAYYVFRDQEETARLILQEFGVNPDTGHIINGHVPVKVKRGESPVKANGKLLVIDGGFSKAYQKETGIAGYTLVYNSYGLLLAAHHPFESAQKAIEEELNIDSTTQILERNDIRIRVKDTDLGRKIQRQIDDLQMLTAAYRSGLIMES
ncbi:MAG TPA: fructose-1,6-bisphosphatase [Anaerolineaceae bacterium]|nr:fructose-1,6-bisphosphatase [Anaerolineaceae bacterium]